MKTKKVAILTDWLSPRGGAEKVIFDLLKIFPEADIFSTIYNKGNLPKLDGKKIITSSLQKLPKFLRKHTLLMPFYPSAVEEFDFSGYDIVIGSSSNITKGIITNPETQYLCYCHTPVRSLWSEHTMFENDPRYKFIPKFILRGLLHKMRIKDFLAAQRVDKFIANSGYIKSRIEKFYRRDANIIHPNCEINTSLNYKKQKGEYFFVNCRLVPTKKIDLLIKAFNKIPEKKLKILGQGSEYENLKKMITGDNIKIIKVNEDIFQEQREKLMSKAIAFLHPQLEDFGITPIEAQSYCVPVIGFGKGGILETVQPGKTGEFFYEQTPESLIEIVKSFNGEKYKKEDFEENIKKFNFENFKKKILEAVEK